MPPLAYSGAPLTLNIMVRLPVPSWLVALATIAGSVSFTVTIAMWRNPIIRVATDGMVLEKSIDEEGVNVAVKL